VLERDRRTSAGRSAAKNMCIVMVCTDINEAEQIGRLMVNFKSGCLVTYRRAEDFFYNAPSSKVVLIILATDESPEALRATLRWLRHRWPRSPVTVVGDSGHEQEMAAREGGACYLTRPVETQQWSSILSHSLGEASGDEVRSPAPAGPTD